MTDKEKKDILSDLDSKIVNYIGKKVLKDVESKINDLLPPQNNTKEEIDPKIEETTELTPSQKYEKPETENETKEEKGIISSIDNKLNELIGKNTADELEEDLLSFIPGHINDVDDLGSKLDNFLTETNHFGIESEEITSKETQNTEKKFTTQKIEDDLQRLKQNIISGSNTIEQNIQINKASENKITDHIVEKKFKDKEIEDALAALKSKCGTQMKQPNENLSQKENKTDLNVSNDEIDSSLQNLLKNLDKK